MNNTINRGSRWVDTCLDCPECGKPILREVLNGCNKTNHFKCADFECGWIQKEENIMEILKLVPKGDFE